MSFGRYLHQAIVIRKGQTGGPNDSRMTGLRALCEDRSHCLRLADYLPGDGPLGALHNLRMIMRHSFLRSGIIPLDACASSRRIVAIIDAFASG
jgi:hypothetical protein